MKKIVLNTFFLFIISSVFSQTTAELLKSRSPKLAVDSIAEALADLAIENPEIDGALADLKSAEYSWKASRFTVLNSIEATGNLNEYTLKGNKQVIDPNNPNASGIIYPRYNFGIRLSLGDLFNSPKTSKSNYYRMISEQEKVKKVKQDIRKEVITAYQELALAQQLLVLEEESMQDETVVFSKSEEKFKKGEITFEAYTSAARLFNSEKVKYITQIKDAKVKQATLEALIGMPLQNALDHLAVIMKQGVPINKN